MPSGCCCPRPGSADYITLDEFHRCGAGIQDLINAHPTNIRYLDNQRDIPREILPKPKYVTTVFQYQQEPDKYQARIANIKVPALRDINQACYDTLRRALEQADGILKKHITDKQGKHRIFCSGYEHLQEMRHMTAIWFKAIHPNPHTYIAYCIDQDTWRCPPVTRSRRASGWAAGCTWVPPRRLQADP